MRLNTDITLNKVIRIIVILIIAWFIYFIISGILTDFFYGLSEDKNGNNRYLTFFNERYQQKISSSTSWKSRLTGYINFYNYDSSKICILELNQYSNINIQNIALHNYRLEEKNDDFTKYSNVITSRESPYVVIKIFRISDKSNSLNLYIDSKIDKRIKNEKYFFLCFKNDSFAVNSIKKYAEITVAIPDEEANYNQLLILKKGDKTLFFLMYGMNKKNNSTISLIDLIDQKYLK